ncbi:uncharacterized protein [Littorina saxatilis]|uniref:uncharacterized protein n=1 Tax=Littorina saxatilis TaxID=31220 RepID=UPI0038B45701
MASGSAATEQHTNSSCSANTASEAERDSTRAEDGLVQAESECCANDDTDSVGGTKLMKTKSETRSEHVAPPDQDGAAFETQACNGHVNSTHAENEQLEETVSLKENLQEVGTVSGSTYSGICSPQKQILNCESTSSNSNLTSGVCSSLQIETTENSFTDRLCISKYDKVPDDKNSQNSSERDLPKDDCDGAESENDEENVRPDPQHDRELSGIDSEHSDITEEDTNAESAIAEGQHSLSGPERRRHTGRRLRRQDADPVDTQSRRITLPDSLRAQWREIGVQWGLQDDNEIARVLLRHYEDRLAGRPPRPPPRPRCRGCGEALVPAPCDNCGPNHHSIRLSHNRDNTNSGGGRGGFCGRCRD